MLSPNSSHFITLAENNRHSRESSAGKFGFWGWFLGPGIGRMKRTGSYWQTAIAVSISIPPTTVLLTPQSLTVCPGFANTVLSKAKGCVSNCRSRAKGGYSKRQVPPLRSQNANYDDAMYHQFFYSIRVIVWLADLSVWLARSERCFATNVKKFNIRLLFKPYPAKSTTLASLHAPRERVYRCTS